MWGGIHLSARDTIIYIPYNLKGGKGNNYSVNMVKILERRCAVVGQLAMKYLK